jgi:hypothetical protein
MNENSMQKLSGNVSARTLACDYRVEGAFGEIRGYKSVFDCLQYSLTESVISMEVLKQSVSQNELGFNYQPKGEISKCFGTGICWM